VSSQRNSGGLKTMHLFRSICTRTELPRPLLLGMILLMGNRFDQEHGCLLGCQTLDALQRRDLRPGKLSLIEGAKDHSPVHPIHLRMPLFDLVRRTTE
jgi:hypothetical protein